MLESSLFIDVTSRVAITNLFPRVSGKKYSHVSAVFLINFQIFPSLLALIAISNIASQHSSKIAFSGKF